MGTALIHRIKIKRIHNKQKYMYLFLVVLFGDEILLRL